MAQPEDDVHRMTVRAGNEKPPPEDPDEALYRQDEGEHAEIAWRALTAGDLKRAIYHLGMVLASDPAREEWLALLDEWTAAAGAGALDYVPLNDENYFATLQAAEHLMRRGNTPDHRLEVTPIVGQDYHARVAVHAAILAAQGQTSAAVALLLQLIQVKPEIPYILWLQRWQNRPDFSDGLDPRLVASIGAYIVQKYPGIYVFSEQGRQELARYLPLLQATYARYPDQEYIGGCYSMLLRKAGFFEEARQVASTAPANYPSLAALGMAEEALGDLDAFIATYRRIIALHPDDISARNDIGKCLLLQGNPTESLACYEESIQLDPSDPCRDAAASIAYLKHLLEPASGEWLERLKALTQRQPVARQFAYYCHAPYIGRLPYAGEAIINMSRHLEEKLATGEIKQVAGETLGVKLSNLESPSAHCAFKRSVEALGASFNLEIGRVSSPDVRQPLHPVEYSIWRYEEMNAVPAVPPPDPAIADQIAALAQQPYALDRWHAPARALGTALGGDALPSLLGVMVHPPECPASWREWDWLNAVQLASALTLAYIDAGWEGSRRHAALTSLIYGPMDWSGAAALIALAVLARQDKRINIGFDHLCLDLWEHRPDQPWALEEAMVMSLIFVDSYSEAAGAKINAYFERQRQEYEQTESERCHEQRI